MRDMFVAQDFVNAFRQQQEINYQINKEHGFEDDYVTPDEYYLGLKIALTHTELSEALEYYRKGDGPSDHIPEFKGVEEELADAIIRIMNIAERMNLRVAEALIAKQAFNAARPFKHGGKKF